MPSPIAEPIPDLARRILAAEPEQRIAIVQDVVSALDAVDEPRAQADAAAELARLQVLLRDRLTADDPTREQMRATTSDLRARRGTTLAVRAWETEVAGRPTVREQVLGALAEPMRPREIAAHLDLHPTKVARAIAELVEAGAVEPTKGESLDRRARYYRAVEPVGAETAEDELSAVLFEALSDDLIPAELFIDALEIETRGPETPAEKVLVSVIEQLAANRSGPPPVEAWSRLTWFWRREFTGPGAADAGGPARYHTGTSSNVGASPPRRSERPDLSLREFEVLMLAARGASNQEIAAELAMSHRAVAVHINKVLAALDTRRPAAAAEP